MPPKKRSASETSTRGANPVKKAKPDDNTMSATSKKPKKPNTLTSASSAGSHTNARGTVSAPVDDFYPNKTAHDKVYMEDSAVDHLGRNILWAVKLNQTNIGQNNNKFYIIQLVENANTKTFAVFTRWGRVGENGQNAIYKGELNEAKKQFMSKFKDKTKNNWEAVRLNPQAVFKFVSGKYDLVETDNTVSKEQLEQLSNAIVHKETLEKEDKSHHAGESADQGKKVVVLPSALPLQVQEMLKIIMSKEMFHATMKEQKVDAKRMPLGKLTKAQLQKGYQALEAIEDYLKSNKSSASAELAQLCSTFYTLIPHDFGRNVPPLVASMDDLKKKYDLLNMLTDIQIALEMEEAAANSKNKTKQVPAAKGKKEKVQVVHEENPLDLQYKELHCDVDVLSPETEEFKVLENYIRATKDSTPYSRRIELQNIYKINREEDKQRMEADHKTQSNPNHEHHYLLFHGTNVAVIAAILKTGLRIMPHSGGRVGKGLYFASEISKSSGYTTPSTAHGRRIGYIFLVEVCMGDKVHAITKDDSSLNVDKVYKTLKCSSALAQGQQEVPLDEGKQHMLPSEFKNSKKKNIKIRVPKEAPQKRKAFEKSSFQQSEYLVYEECKARVKYMCEFKFA